MLANPSNDLSTSGSGTHHLGVRSNDEPIDESNPIADFQSIPGNGSWVQKVQLANGTLLWALLGNINDNDARDASLC
jgi:hypothetical protein